MVGVYHYAHPDQDTAHDEAQYFLSVAGPYIGTGFLPPVLDVENSEEIGKATLSQWIIEWCTEVEAAAGTSPIIYAERSYAANYFETAVNQFPLWVALANADTPNSDPGNIGIWPVWMLLSSTGLESTAVHPRA